MQTPAIRSKRCHSLRQGHKDPQKCHFTQAVVFMQKITHQHVLQNGQSIKAQQAQQLEQYSQDQIVEPTQQYLNETVAQHLQGLTPNFTAVRHNLQVCMPMRSPLDCTATHVNLLLSRSILYQQILCARHALTRLSGVLLLLNPKP